MSQFVVAGSCYRDESCLVQALMRVGGWTVEQIELHVEPTNLYGYHGDRRADLANVIVRRKFIGAASNDIGFLKQADGTYNVIISEFDRHKFTEGWETRLTDAYNEERVIKECRLMGYSYQIEEKNGERQLIAYVTG
jgi:hypothetical protein